MNEMTNRTRRTHRTAGALALRIALGMSVAALGGLFVGARWGDELAAWLGAGTPSAAPTENAAKILWTCGMHPQVIQDHPGDCPICHMKLTPLASSAGAAGDGHAIAIDPVVVQSMGVRVAQIRSGPLRKTIYAAGVLAEPEPNHFDVNLRVSGWIEKLHAAVDGMHVERGDPLFELYSPELQIAIEELLAASRARATPDGTAPGSSSRTAEVLFSAARRRLELLGLTPEQLDGFLRDGHAPASITFLSPMTGHVTEKLVYPGAAVKAGDRVLRLADQTTMWLDVQVFEQDLPFVRIGQHARATLESLPGQRLEGDIHFIHPHLDPMSRTALVRIVLPNAELALRQGMYARVEIEAELAPDVLLAPREAVIDTGVRQIAFVALGGGRFEPRAVVMGRAADDGLVEILSGLVAGESIVTSGQFLLDSESRIREAIQKHLANGLSSPPRVPGTSRSADGPEAPQDVVDRLFQAYFALEDQLGAVETDTRPVDVRSLNAAAATLVESSQGATTALARHVSEAATELARLALAEQRERVKVLNDAMIQLADRAPPSRAIAPRVFVMHCPMAPGSWLSPDEHVANPYYATTMKQCGEIVRTIEAAQER